MTSSIPASGTPARVPSATSASSAALRTRKYSSSCGTRSPAATASPTAAQLHALDPGLIRHELDATGATIVSVSSLLAVLRQRAAEFGRPDLAQAAQWLTDH